MYHSPFEIVYMNLWGLAPFSSTSGFIYYVAFINVYSKYILIYFLKHKFEIFHAFKLFHKFFQTQFNTAVKYL